MSKFKILAVDDEKASLNSIYRTLRKDFDVILSANGFAALEVLKDQEIAVLLADQRMPEMTGVELFQKARETCPDTVRVLITGYTDIEAIIEAINAGGVFHYISKPWEPDDLKLMMHRAAEHYALIKENHRLLKALKQKNQQLEAENVELHQLVERQYDFSRIVGQSGSMTEVLDLLKKVIPTDTTVLIRGETGTGKEIIAKAIHFNSNRKDKKFVAQNCAALTDTLLESELFGHVKGAFTGASANKQGLFERANGGTVFLDEIGDTSPGMQQRLLRVLQEGEISPVGGEYIKKVNVRIIAATNKNLEEAMQAGKFREDLFYRLNIFPIYLPPLRQRREDIPLLARFLLKKHAENFQKNIAGISDSALKYLSLMEFPGNVRQLENEILRAVTLANENEMLTEKHFSQSLKPASGLYASLMSENKSLKEIVESIEKYLIVENLKNHSGNITHTAEHLGLSRVGLQKKIQRYKISEK